nr:AC4 protein [Clerodendron golden mosaic virus]UOQ23442.1 AC4 protein [Clerodendron golden mosaic virus]
MPKIIFSLIHNAHSQKKKLLPDFWQLLHQPIKNSSRFAENSTKMGALISTCLCNSRANSNARINDSSIWYPQQDQPTSILTSRGQNRAPTSSPIWTRTETHWNGENSRSTGDLHEEVHRQLMMLTPRRLTLGVSTKLLRSLKN